MEVVVDGRTGMGVPEEGGVTFQVLFDALRRSAARKRRVVVSWTLDGETLSPERQADLAGQGTAPYGLLEVRTADPLEVAGPALRGLRGHLDNLARAHDEAIGCMASGEYARALGKFDDCFHGWDILLRAVRDLGALASVDFKGLRAGGESVELRVRDLQESLLRFGAAVEFKDADRILSLLRDELKPQLADWREVLGALERHLAGPAP
jgi:hypothetical protein